MEQFREIGEVIGSIKALMVFKNNIQINQRQCTLLLDIFNSTYDSIAESMRLNLRFEEKNTSKWKILEQPLKELLCVVREGESYVKMSLEPKLGFWAKAIVLQRNRDCAEMYIHNLLSCVPIVIEAVENASEVSGWDEEEMEKKRLVNANKYIKQWNDFDMFTWKFGREYLVTADFTNRFEDAWREDRWILVKTLGEKNQPGSSKHDRKMADFLLKSLEDGNNHRLFPSSILVSAKDYQVKRRLGNGSQYKEITWLGESFALMHFFGDIELLLPQVTPLLSLSHPNIVCYLCGFTDEEKKECFLVMELMSKTLGTHIKELCGPRKKHTLSLPVAVDLMLQISRGMEYLHSKGIHHGELNPSNILVKPRRDGYLHGKILGFGLSSIKAFSCKSPSSAAGQNENFPFIWYSPEVLEEQEKSGTATGSSLKYSDKSDVYSFGMVCFELLTGKVPFEDSHLQGDKMSRNIRAGERPLFPFHSPKFITNLTKRCWHDDPNQRPSFSSISRILRYIRRFIALNPECHSSRSQQDSPVVPPVDYCDIETKLMQKLSWESTELSEVPFQMFAYSVVERAKTSKRNNTRDNTSDSGSEWASCSEDEGGTGSDEQVSSEKERRFSSSNDIIGINKKPVSKLLQRASGLKPIQKPARMRAGLDKMSKCLPRRKDGFSTIIGISKKPVSKLLQRASGLKPIEKPGTPRKDHGIHDHIPVMYLTLSFPSLH